MPRLLGAGTLAVLLAACSVLPAAHTPTASLTPPPTLASPSPSFAASRTADPSAVSASPTPSAAASRPPASAVLVTHGRRDQRRIALTFDADMTVAMRARWRAGGVPSWYDARIVAELRSTGTPATVFVTGLWAETYPEVVQSLAADPLFEIENHSYDHAAFRSPCYRLPIVSTDAARTTEVRDGASAIAAAGGGWPIYFRFPGGCHTAADLTLVAGLDETPIGWDVVSGDAFQSNPKVIVNQVLARVQSGSIVVLHLIGAPHAPATADALKTLIPELRARGYVFVTLRELLAN